MTFLEERDLELVPSIPEYYKGKTIFITGGTGFIGKILLEKLLYSCPDLDRIYLLLRPKKGVKPEERLAALYSSKCYDRLRQKRQGAFESKVFCVEGDCSEIGLGLSEEDRALIVNRTHVIFHSAASVRFDDPLKVSAKLNLRGTREIIELANHMKNLESLIHVSTCFTNPSRDDLDEILYPPYTDWRDFLEICENIDDHTLNILTPKYLDEVPNTYIFNKQLAEHVVYEHKGKLPIIIVRPSVVVHSISEPVPGWLENFNGPLGLIIASGKGILRIAYCEPTVHPDAIPVDSCVKSMIAASWIRGTEKLKSTDDIPIINACNGSLCLKITTDELLEFGLKALPQYPLDSMVWCMGTTLSRNKSVYFIKVIFQHLLPAMILDSLLWLFGKQPMVLKLQRRIYTANLAVQLFITKQWTFYNRNFLSLGSNIKKEDKEDFYYILEQVNIDEYLTHGIIGARRYLLREKDEDLPKARAHFKRMALIDKFVKSIFFGCILWVIINSSFARKFYNKIL